MKDQTALQALIGIVIFAIVLIDRLMPHRCGDCRRRREEEYNRRCQAHWASFPPPRPPRENFVPRTMETPAGSPPPKPRK